MQLILQVVVAASLFWCGWTRGVRGRAGKPASVVAAASPPRRERDRTIIIPDLQPVVLNFTNTHGAHVRSNSTATGGPFATNPKNGTPWFRMKRRDQMGQASHEHLRGLFPSESFDTDVQRAHNFVRERIGLQPLQWSSQLQALAADHVNKLVDEGCYIGHSSTAYRWNEAGFQYIGENLYKVINMVPTGVDIVDAWYAEIEDYTYGPVGSSCVEERCLGRVSPPCMMGHFTQVMWESTMYLGCALRQCPGEQQETFIAVCQYGPGGNIVGNVPFAQQYAAALGFGREPCV